MTDRINALTVVLERDIREDDAQPLIDAIKMMKGVISVTSNIVTPDSYVAQIRANNKVTNTLSELINKITTGEL